jgi:uncharacterized phage protein gp47/JayE
MSNLTLKSENQILGEMLSTLFSKTGLTDINPGSVLLTLLEAVARQDFQQNYQMLQILKNYNLDTTTGSDLDNRAFEYGLTRTSEKQATGQVKIQRESSFEKISTGFYSGFRAPLTGDSSIYVDDASDFGSSGTLILGRGTVNEEEVNFTSTTNNTNYWTVALSGTITNDHGIEESVILKQGSNVTIPAGTFIQVPSTSKNSAIVFQTLHEATILAGEAEVTKIDVRALEAGIKGNIPVGAINGTSAFPSAPFAGARAYNDTAFTTGEDRETDSRLRDRIKSYIQGLSQSTKKGILDKILGLVDAETSKRVVSANVIEPISRTEAVNIYIDDGTGFEPSFVLKGQESILASANGLETRLQVDQFPIVKAYVESTNEEPFDFTTNNLTLIIGVGNDSETITFDNTLFTVSEAASADEIVNIINDNSLLVTARTSENGTKVFITAKSDTNDEITILGGTANASNILNFPTDTKNTFYLYKNDRLLVKDGSTAFIDSAIGTYDFSGAPEALSVTVDGKTTNNQTVTFQLADFVDPSQATPEEIAAVINAQLAGATAIAYDEKVRIISNTEKSSESKIKINASAAATTLGFSLTEVSGADADYILNPELGIIGFTEALEEDDLITAGTRNTRAFVTAANAENYTTLNGTTLTIKVDDGVAQTITFTANTNVSAQVIADEINSQLIGALAVTRTKGSDTFLEIRTNSYSTSYGKIEVTGGSALSVFAFPTDPDMSISSHVAYSVCSSAGPWSFVQGNTLIVILDNDPTNRTYVITIHYSGTATSGSSTTVLADTALASVFDSNDEINSYYLVMTSGSNTTTGSGTVTTVTNTSGNTYRYTLSGAPSNFADFAVGDQVVFSSMANPENDGTFLVTGISTGGPYYIEVTNALGVAESGSTGTAIVQQRRQISDYVGATGSITLGSALRATPSIGDTFVVMPSTMTNLHDFLNNRKITSLNTRASIELVNQGDRLQISSNEDGSDGYVQVAGGKVNDLVQFSTSNIRGKEGYAYYTGLTKLVHKTIYGDETDLESYPGVGASGIRFQIRAPSTQEVSIALNVTLAEGLSLSSIENEIKSQVISYVNSLGVGESVIISNIVKRVLNALSGVKDVKITSPSDNVQISENEVAKTRASLITLGQI